MLIALPLISSVLWQITGCLLKAESVNVMLCSHSWKKLQGATCSIRCFIVMVQACITHFHSAYTMYQPLHLPPSYTSLPETDFRCLSSWQFKYQRGEREMEGGVCNANLNVLRDTTNVLNKLSVCSFLIKCFHSVCKFCAVAFYNKQSVPDALAGTVQHWNETGVFCHLLF